MIWLSMISEAVYIVVKDRSQVGAHYERVRATHQNADSVAVKVRHLKLVVSRQRMFLLEVTSLLLGDF
jgi:hypothetical protein